MAPIYGSPRVDSGPRVPQSHELVSPKWESPVCLYLHGDLVSPSLTREDTTLLRNNCFSGHPPKIRARAGTPEWSHRYEAWSSLGHLVNSTWWMRSRDLKTPAKGEKETRVHKDPAQITLLPWLFLSIWGELWKCWGNHFKADRHWSRRAVLMSRMTSSRYYKLEELWRNLRHWAVKQMSNVQLLSGTVWYENKQSNFRTCVLCCENI